MGTNQTITIHQAFYGEVSRAHGCITSTLKDEQLNSFLTSFSDKPSRIPAGVALYEYIAGCLYKDYFVLIKTGPDPSTVRSGMVFTHALILQNEDLDDINDLGTLLSYFTETIPPKTQNLLPIQIPIIVKKGNISAKKVPVFIYEAAKKIVQGEKIVFFGSIKNFKNVLENLWNGIPRHLRKYLSFNIGFTLLDINDLPYQILYFQKDQLTKVNYANAVTDVDVSLIEATEQAVNLVLGYSNENDFNDFLKKLSITLNDISELVTVNKAYKLFKRKDQLDPNDLRQLLRLLSKLCPDPDLGSDLKGELINQLALAVNDGRDKNIKALRNIDVQFFHTAEESLKVVVTVYVKTQVTTHSYFNLEKCRELIDLVSNKIDTSWWHVAVHNGLMDGFKDPSSINNLWQLLIQTDNNENLYQIIEQAETSELDLLNSFPDNLLAIQASKLKIWFKQKEWYRLYAKANLAYQLPTIALSEQLEIERAFKLSEASGVRLITSNLSDTELLSVDLIELDDKTLELLEERLLVDYSLLNILDLENVRWHTIWSRFLFHRPNLELGILDVKSKIQALYDLISQGRQLPDNIIELLSNSQYANLSSYKKRPLFWNSVPVKFKKKFLLTTTIAMVDVVINGEIEISNIETEISEVLKSDGFVSDFLSKNRNDFAKVIGIYETVPDLKDQFLSDYIYLYKYYLSDTDSRRLGNLITKYQLVKSAAAVFEKAKMSTSFQIALNVCKSLLHLGLLDRFMFRRILNDTLIGFNPHEALFEIATQLYKQGPEDNDIWQRAGGDISKLHDKKSREENWRVAISLVQSGGGGKNITAMSLLKEMEKDFPFNPIISELKKQFKR
ncbi:hypothetical protein GCM10027592_63020 [Spirosoma flavus]